MIDDDNESVGDLEERRSDDFINERVGLVRSSTQQRFEERVKSSRDDTVAKSLKEAMAKMREENENLQESLDVERAKIRSMLDNDVKQSSKYKRELDQLQMQIAKLEELKKENDERQKKLQKMASDIKSVELKNIQREVIQNFLTPKHTLILDHLRNSWTQIDSSLSDRVPRLSFEERNEEYIVSVVGFDAHHKAFRAMLERIWNFLNVIQAAKGFYQRELNRMKRQLLKQTFSHVSPRTSNWQEYAKLFSQFFEEKISEYGKKFDEHIEAQSKPLVDQCILGKLDKFWIHVRKETESFMDKNRLMNEIDSIKQRALDEFIDQNITLQRLKLDTKPSEKSIEVLKEFINIVKSNFKSDPQYQGHEVKHFSSIPKLLRQLMLYYSAFKIQLPLFELSGDLLDKIAKNAVTTIATSTGSGKSTLLPALLAAEGYDKVIVTQPRRLPCRLICDRVNETMIREVRPASDRLAGWAVSGKEVNPQADVLYLTDGLLKERLLNDENFITTYTKVNKSVVFFIDEVHERSVNIDLCLALLARLLTIKPELKSKMKVIISSATLDASVPTLFKNIPQAGLAEFKMPQMGTLHPVTKVPRLNENVLDIVQELCKKRKRHEQILCFVSSVGDVNESCKLLNDISKGTIVAYPLVQSQRSSEQRHIIEHGTIFFSTTVAETSLTFPCLKYVVDSGMINTPVYDFKSKRTVLKEVRAAESNIKQRLGRLGRTQPGEYYFVYDFNVEELRYPVPQICQSDLMNVEFSLRKSPLQKGFEYLAKFLPDKPSQNDIAVTVAQLVQLGK